ncbi:ABC transporter ATP-binding protein/permease [Alphaproteobacteria bacterium]|nr:ABC transporter ATP-binding protein/permease [Alphaproteobacteria bacterium]
MAFFEVFAIGALVPFLVALTNPVILFEHELLQPFIYVLGISSPGKLLFPLTFLFIVLTIVAAILRMTLIWANSIFAYSSGGDLSIKIYGKILHQPYLQHTLKNSSEVVNGILIKTNAVTQHTILPILVIISGLFIIASVLIAFVIINPSIALIVYGTFGIMYFLIMKTIGRFILRNGEHIAEEATKIIKTLQESLGGIREVIIDSSQDVHVRAFGKSIELLKKSQGYNEVFGQGPRYLVEMIGMVVIAISAYYLVSQNNSQPDEIIAVFGVIALAAQRLLPIVQQVYHAWTSMLSSKQSLSDSLDLLEVSRSVENIKNVKKYIKFEKEIHLKDVTFSYSKQGNVTLNNMNLKIFKGEKIGIIGETGGGKSTLVDLIMGLFPPTEGAILIDKRPLNQENIKSWQSNIAHVTQKIYLIDGSVSENIAYGIEKNDINLNLVKKVAKQALADNFILKLPKKYETKIGEDGVLLSGGQRQRIGIARALYKDSEVIVLDEATSALDNQTERKIMNSINHLERKKTILIIAHRLTTLKECSKIIKIKNGRVDKIMTYDEVISNDN